MIKNIQNSEYSEILQQLVAEIKSTRLVLAQKVNTTLIQLYWNVGKHITEKKLIEGHGKGVVLKLSTDLKLEFPDYGFSSRSVWEMKRFFETYCQADTKLQQLVAVLPWGHNLLLMQKTKDPNETYYYANAAVEMGWSRNVLLNFIKANTYQNSINIPKQHNFETALPEHLQEQADEILKSRYSLAFLGVAKPMRELELEKRLVEKIKHFILELGSGFTFIGNQYRLTLNEKEYFVDMLFFHRKLKSLIAIELKIGDFKPEYVGKMSFYLSLLDMQMKMPDENPSIGIILCADKETMEVAIALQDAKHPIAVADYQLGFPEENIKQMLENELAAELKIELENNKEEDNLRDDLGE
jgi:predicted nuclease of restriction endonuclease-like (RecB) superfamily